MFPNLLQGFFTEEYNGRELIDHREKVGHSMPKI
jgi:hypothetical protein